MFIRNKEKDLINSYNKVISFCNIIRDEVKNSYKIYGYEEAEGLRNYYASFLKDNTHFNYIRHNYALRLMHLISNVKKNTKLLDVGCGYGSETILCGSIGSKVLGIDISENRIDLAKKRVKFFETKLNKNINIDFSLRNLFKHFGKYNLIWVNEAIHHIAPLKEFLDISYQNLDIGGKLIIADQNRLNPYTYILSKKAQKKHGGIYITKKEELTGDLIHYAVERIYTIREIKAILIKIFKNIEVYPFGYIPFFIYKNFNTFSVKFERNYLRKLPIIRQFSVGYVIISKKKS